MSQVFIARQPILNADEQIHAYELLHRKGMVNRAIIQTAQAANAAVIHNLVQHFGPSELLGDSLGFVNADLSFLRHGQAQLLPADKTVLELQPETQFEAEDRQQIKDLAEAGYQMALDGFRFEGWYLQQFKPILGYMKYIKVDLNTVSPHRLTQQMPLVRKLKRKTIASKVENREQFQMCRELGFDYFQGFFFAKPEILNKQVKDPNRLVLSEALGALSGEGEIEDVERILMRAPDVSVSLLRYLNCGAFGLKQDVRSLRHAMTLLGRQKLLNWLAVMLFVSGKRPQPSSDPLLLTALTRARMMQNLCLKADNNKYVSVADVAFFTGMLSAAEGLLQIPLETVLDNIRVHQRIREALVEHRGILGEILSAVEAAETNADNLDFRMHQINIPEDLFYQQIDNAHSWASEITASLQSA